MDYNEAKSILQYHQAWRRGDDSTMVEPKLLGEAIDAILDPWISVKVETPIAYRSGEWDGQMSDKVIAEDQDGKRYLAVLYEGTMDGTNFKDWYDDSGLDIKKDIVRWLKIPE